MAKAIRSLYFEAAILDAFGLSDRMITRLVLTIDIDKPPMLDVTERVWVDDPDGLQRLTEQLRTFRLVPTDDDEGEPS